MSTQKNLKFSAKNSSYFYTLTLSKEELELFKSIVHNDNYIVLYKKAEQIDEDYRKKIEATGKLYGNRDESYYSLYDATKYTIGAGNVYNILDKTESNNEGLFEVKLNSMHIYVSLEIIKLVYSSKAQKYIDNEHAFHNNSLNTKTMDAYLEEKNEMINELENIKKLDLKVRESTNPREILTAEKFFNSLNLKNIDEFLKKRYA